MSQTIIHAATIYIVKYVQRRSEIKHGCIKILARLLNLSNKVEMPKDDLYNVYNSFQYSIFISLYFVMKKISI